MSKKTLTRISLLCGVVFVSLVVAHDQEGEKSINNSAGAGIGGNGPWDHSNVTLLAHLPLADMGGGPSNVLCNDIWGWTDPLTGKEYAIVGLTNGTSFVDISDPFNPQYLGKLNTQTGNKTWRDMKVYNNHVYVVADSNGSHGIQVFDLTQLRNVDPSNPQSFSNTGHYSGFNRAHNIVINEATGYAYPVGTEYANGGLLAYDLQNPVTPTYVGWFNDDGYTHDAQVVIYDGPDQAHVGQEIAFNANEDTLTIVNVTDKSNMFQISRTGYPDSEYCHQGWLSEDHRYFYMNDELDEWRAEELIPTRTRVWNVQDLDAPVYMGHIDGAASTIDHNLYVKSNYIYQANYTSGLRILKVNDPATLDIEEYGYFDTYNTDNNVSFNGAWSCYPFFESGTIIVSDRQNGLFVVKMDHQEVALTSLVPVQGSQQSGNLADLSISNDDKVELGLRKRKDGQYEFNSICPFETVSDLSFTLEGRINVFQNQYNQTFELYNFTTAQWETFSSPKLGHKKDVRFEIKPTGNLSRFVDSNSGLMKARLTLNQTGNSKKRWARNPIVFLDQAVWTVAE